MATMPAWVSRLFAGPPGMIRLLGFSARAPVLGDTSRWVMMPIVCDFGLLRFARRSRRFVRSSCWCVRDASAQPSPRDASLDTIGETEAPHAAVRFGKQHGEAAIARVQRHLGHPRLVATDAYREPDPSAVVNDLETPTPQHFADGSLMVFVSVGCSSIVSVHHTPRFLTCRSGRVHGAEAQRRRVCSSNTSVRVFGPSTILRLVKVEPEDLLNASEVAALLGLAHRQAIATYRARYDDFPSPLINKGTCVLWLREDVQRWAEATGRL